MEGLRRLYANLRLQVNEATKSAVARPWDRKFLGYSFWVVKGTVKRRIADKAWDAMKERVRLITGRARGRSLREVITELGGFVSGLEGILPPYGGTVEAA